MIQQHANLIVFKQLPEVQNLNVILILGTLPLKMKASYLDHHQHENIKTMISGAYSSFENGSKLFGRLSSSS